MSDPSNGRESLDESRLRVKADPQLPRLVRWSHGRRPRGVDADPHPASAASPPWAVTGEQSPAERAAKEEQAIMGVLSALEKGEAVRRRRRRRTDSDSDSEEEGKRGLLRRKRRERKLTRAIVLQKEREERPCCGVSASHMVLYVGFTGSVLLWAACFWLGIVVRSLVAPFPDESRADPLRCAGRADWFNKGFSRPTKLHRRPRRCRAAAVYGVSDFSRYRYETVLTARLLQDLGLMLLAVVVFVASVINPLVRDQQRSGPQNEALQANHSLA